MERDIQTLDDGARDFLTRKNALIRIQQTFFLTQNQALVLSLLPQLQRVLLLSLSNRADQPLFDDICRFAVDIFVWLMSQGQTWEDLIHLIYQSIQNGDYERSVGCIIMTCAANKLEIIVLEHILAQISPLILQVLAMNQVTSFNSMNQFIIEYLNMIDPEIFNEWVKILVNGREYNLLLLLAKRVFEITGNKQEITNQIKWCKGIVFLISVPELSSDIKENLVASIGSIATSGPIIFGQSGETMKIILSMMDILKNYNDPLFRQPAKNKSKNSENENDDNEMESDNENEDGGDNENEENTNSNRKPKPAFQYPETHAGYACQVIDHLTTVVPAKFFMDELFAIIFEQLNLKDSERRQRIKVILEVLTAITEGVSYFLRMNMKVLMTELLNLTKENFQNDFITLECLLLCIAEIAYYCQPEFSDYSYETISSLVNILYHGEIENNQILDEETKKNYDNTVYLDVSVCLAINSICEAMSPQEINPILAELTTKLLYLLQKNDLRIQEASIAALNGVVTGAEEYIAPSTPFICQIVSQVLNSDNELLLELQGNALVVLSTIASNAPKEFEPFKFQVLQYVLDWLASDDEEKLALGIQSCDSLILYLKEDVAPYIPQIITTIKNCLFDKEFEVFSLNNDVVVQEDEIVQLGYRVTSSKLKLKLFSLILVGSLSKHAGRVFAPYAEEIFWQVIRETQSIIMSVASGAIEQLPSCLLMISKYRFGAASTSDESFVLEIENEIFDSLTEILYSKEDKELVIQVFDSFSQMIDDFGHSFALKRFNEIISALFQIIEGSTPMAEDYIDASSGLLDFDALTMVIESCLTTVSVLMKHINLKQISSHELNEVIASMSRLLLDELPKMSLDNTLGFLGDLTLQCPDLTIHVPYVQAWQPRIISAIAQRTNEPCMRNGIFALSCIIAVVAKNCQNSPQVHAIYITVKSELRNLLALIIPFFEKNPQKTKNQRAITDNAVSCLCSVIIGYLDIVPLLEVLPLLLSILPIEDDWEEAPNVFTCLTTLIESAIPPTDDYLPSIFEQISIMINNPKIRKNQVTWKLMVSRWTSAFEARSNSTIFNQSMQQISQQTRFILESALERKK